MTGEARALLDALTAANLLILVEDAIERAAHARVGNLTRRRAAIAANAFRLEDRDRIAEAEARCHAYARYERALYEHMNACSSASSVDEAAE